MQNFWYFDVITANMLTSSVGVSDFDSFLFGDLNDDGMTNWEDFRLWKTTAIWSVDSNANGSIDQLDFSTVSQMSVPEPSTWMLGVLAVFCVRRNVR
jgi:hypothetical protein